jgi:large subunit ribosomal protein L27
MAHRGGKKTTGISRNTNPKYLGIKLFAGQKTKPGSILVRQRGSKILPGKNVLKGKDDTLYTVKEGSVAFRTKKCLGFDGQKKIKKIIDVI